jgi:hypothetical protein
VPANLINHGEIDSYVMLDVVDRISAKLVNHDRDCFESASF